MANHVAYTGFIFSFVLTKCENGSVLLFTELKENDDWLQRQLR